jgi:diguanylate cyclase (GGDEF)-like protein
MSSQRRIDDAGVPAIESATVAVRRSIRADLEVARSARFRASQRRLVRGAARSSLLLAIAAALLNIVWLGAVYPNSTPQLVPLNLAVALVGLLGYALVGTVARRHPEAVVFAVVVFIGITTAILRVAAPDLSLVAAGYGLLLPPIVALIMPWSTGIHSAWLTVHVALVIGATFLAPAGTLRNGGPGGMVELLIVAVVISEYGHLAGLRARTQAYVQVSRIAALHRQGLRDRVRLDRLNAILEQSATTDDLTGLGNRLGLTAELSVVRSRIARHGETYALLMLDLDHFKEVNDRLGHLAGDDVLRSVADIVRATIRTGDRAFRYGGEELLIISRVAVPAEGLAVAERIREGVDALAIPHPGNTPHNRVTVSIGVATIGPGDLDAGDDDWLGAADRAMYEAKAAGRNRSLAATSIGVYPNV